MPIVWRPNGESLHITPFTKAAIVTKTNQTVSTKTQSMTRLANHVLQSLRSYGSVPCPFNRGTLKLFDRLSKGEPI